MGLPPRFLLVIAILISSLPGCVFKDWRTETDATLNPWLGKSIDERMKRVGPPVQCAKLRDGGEVCDWVFRRLSYSGGNWDTGEHHAIFTYDSNGIAREWNYRGSQGQRSSKDSLVKE